MEANSGASIENDGKLACEDMKMSLCCFDLKEVAGKRRTCFSFDTSYGSRVVPPLRFVPSTLT